MSAVGDVVSQVINGISGLPFSSSAFGVINSLMGNNGNVQDSINEVADAVSNTDDATLDPTGYDQSSWDLEKTRELLEEQRAYNSAEAQKTRDWQERMSNTAYQRAVEDLQAAGLNKWLAISGGNGASASTPSGATASSSSGDASTPNPKLAETLIKALTSIFNSGLSVVGKALK